MEPVRIPLEEGWYLAVESEGRIERFPITAYEVSARDAKLTRRRLAAGKPPPNGSCEVEVRLPRRIVEAGYRVLDAFHAEHFPEPAALA
jgi:hypothetical protein